MIGWPTWSLAYYISEWLIRVVMLFVVTRRRRPTSAMAWMLIIFFLPWAGLVLYLLLGRHRLPRRRVREYARLLTKLEDVHSRFEDHPHMVEPQLGAGAAGAVALAARLGYMPILGGNDVQLMASNDRAINQLIADIDASRQHVHLLFYIYADDDAGRRVSEALVRAARRGVTCRVLADAVGSRGLFGTLGVHMADNGVEVREALPVGLFRRSMARMDVRNHRKLAVIDGRIAYTGSLNIIGESRGAKEQPWRDLTVRMTGPIVLELQTVFVGDWHFETDEMLDAPEILPDPELTGAVAAQTLPSGPNYPTENYERMVVAALHAAHERATLTTPYFVPDDALMQALQVAVLRGVDVEMILPRRSDHWLVDAASRAYYDDLLDAGVRIHLFHGGVLHAKAMSIDDTIAFIGSSNFDIRSFSLNLEINLLFYGAEVTHRLREIQRQYIDSSNLLTAQEWAKRSRVRAAAQNIAKLLSPLL